MDTTNRPCEANYENAIDYKKALERYIHWLGQERISMNMELNDWIREQCEPKKTKQVKRSDLVELTDGGDGDLLIKSLMPHVGAGVPTDWIDGVKVASFLGVTVESMPSLGEGIDYDLQSERLTNVKLATREIRRLDEWIRRVNRISESTWIDEFINSFKAGN